MKRAQWIFLLFLSLAPFLGCSETQTPLTPEEPSVEGMSKTNVETYAFTAAEFHTHINYAVEKARFSDEPPACWIYLYADSDTVPPPIPEPIHAEMFEELLQLRQQFQGNVLEDNFKILRQLTASQIYKAYLANTFPRDESFETLDEFWKVPPPPTEDFLRLFEGILENPADEQIAFIYRAMLAYKCFYSTDITARKCGGSVGLGLANLPDAVVQNREELHRRNRGQDRWLIDLGAKKYGVFNERYRNFAEDAIHADKRKIRGFFNEYGVNDGLIWLAIQEPELTGFFLSNFRDEAVFQGWVNP